MSKTIRTNFPYVVMCASCRCFHTLEDNWLLHKAYNPFAPFCPCCFTKRRLQDASDDPVAYLHRILNHQDDFRQKNTRNDQNQQKQPEESGKSNKEDERDTKDTNLDDFFEKSGGCTAGYDSRKRSRTTSKVVTPCLSLPNNYSTTDIVRDERLFSPSS
mmetsp:Transcript_12652/g.16318  ORF Transcript_12652/g.16318 Transcript_12652/m.16318 type:complete len:159 (+) Transcript_12652:7652-8128(+)